jgi:toxin ParE1/3/4
MSFQIEIEAQAQEELAQAIQYYDEQEPGIGQRFAADVRELFVKHVAEDPDRFPKASRLTHKARIHGWPYSIYFTVDHNLKKVIITTVWHGSCDPRKLKRRIT